MNVTRSVLFRVCGAVLAGVAIAIPATPLLVEAGEVLYVGGPQFSTGHYEFADRTNSVYLFNGISFSTSRWGFSASIPLFYQNTSLVSSAGPGWFRPGRPWAAVTTITTVTGG